MTLIVRLPALLSCLLFGAHALRWGDPGLTACMLLLSAAVVMRRPWLRPVLAAALAWGLFVWLDTAVELTSVRRMLGQDWGRMAAILGGVFLLDAAALLALLSPLGHRAFGRPDGRAWARASAFLLTFLLLDVSRAMAPFEVLLADRFLPGWGRFEIGLLALYASWLTGHVLDPARHAKLRPVFWGFFSLVFFGQLALGLAGAESFLMTGQLHLPVPALILGGPLFRGDGFFMAILFASSVVLLGPAWCSHLCYIGAWDDASSRLADKDGQKRPASMGRLPLLGRGLTLLLTILAALGLRAAGVAGPTAIWLAVAFGLAGVGVMLFASRRRGAMVHCSTYCPMGLAGNLLGKLSPWRMAMDENCTACGRCAKACRYGALEPYDIASRRPGLSCTLCGDCVSACRHGSMAYRAHFLSPASARAAFLVLAVSLHAAFLGLARI
ncbi:4Fe-4S binding protein [Desulfohalovibrio reitneri]|uniref:4Fe-4S binding protein n=1 Tax=Desulfohalovibrio reitneri TaxID=1307759 RepID=UPI0004A6AD63|nr:4Fe-4S binding protein [Desulfohalovibrio reitneri]